MKILLPRILDVKKWETYSRAMIDNDVNNCPELPRSNVSTQVNRKP
jgi:hypothetical protein